MHKVKIDRAPAKIPVFHHLTSSGFSVSWEKEPYDHDLFIIHNKAVSSGSLRYADQVVALVSKPSISMFPILKTYSIYLRVEDIGVGGV